MAVGLALLIAIVAALYASVGLAGATGYLAVMGLFGVEPGAMKGASLLLNAAVAAVGMLVFGRTGGRPPGLFWPIAVPSVPMAMLGGAVPLPDRLYLPIVGTLMIASAARLARRAGDGADPEGGPPRPAPLGGRIALGAGIGFASGLTGTGGGIFLLPALQFLGWAGPRAAAAVASPFVLATSVAGMVGHLARQPCLPTAIALWVPAAVLGGLIGARSGRDRLDPTAMRRILAVLLAVAGLRLLLP